MASDPAKSSRNAAKWGFVGVLGVVLVAVVAWQIFGGRGDASSAEAAPTTEENAERPSQRLPRRLPTKGLTLTPRSNSPINWPTIPLAQAIAHDPFAPEVLPGVEGAASAASGDDVERAAEQQRAAMLAETLDGLRQRGVSMLLHTADGPVATIGDRTIKVGDTVGDYRVTEIDADGVVLEPTPPK